MNSVKIVEEFWDRVWKARNPAAIDITLWSTILCLPPAVSMSFQLKGTSKFAMGLGGCEPEWEVKHRDAG